MRGVVGADGEGTSEREEMLAIGRKMHLMMVTGAMTMGIKLHSGIISATDIEIKADTLTTRLNALSLQFHYRHHSIDRMPSLFSRPRL